MQETLAKYLPDHAVNPLFELIKEHQIYLKIVRERRTRHGDYRQKNGHHQITINANLNRYRFLITLVHEIAHLLAFKQYGRRIRPHGKEWKYTFQQLMLPFIHPSIFPEKLLPIVANHFRNPSASSDTDTLLAVALKSFDPENDKNYVFELPEGSVFRIYNGKVFQKGRKRVKRYECKELSTGKIYIFQPNAEVELVKVS